MKQLLFLLSFFSVGILSAQEATSASESLAKEPTTCECKSVITKEKPFGHLDIGFTAGSTGLGLDVNVPVCKYLTIRAGFSAMPRFTFTRDYTMSAVDGTGSAGLTDERMDRLVGYLGQMINSDQVDKYVNMEHEVKFINAKLLFDIHPFKKKEWFFTTGVYVGPKRLGTAINAQSEAPTMIAVNMYNQMYDQIRKLDEYEFPSLHIGQFYFEMDPDQGQMMKDAFLSYGRVAVILGEYPDGTPHYFTPDANGVMEAKAECNAVKPYLGFGYAKRLGKNSRWTLGANVGVLFWGKTHVYCNDGVDLVHDVDNIGGPVGDYIKLLKKFPVYPNLEMRLAYTIF